MIVADTGYNRILVFDPTTCPNPDGANTPCTPILQFGSLGSGSGQLNTPRDVAVDAAHNIYVADAANSRIEAFNDTGSVLWTAGGPGKLAQNLNVPIGLSYDATTNEVLVADTGHSLIKAYARGVAPRVCGAEPTSGSRGKDPQVTARSRRGPDGEIWVADYHNQEIKAFPCSCTASSTSWNSTPNKWLGDGKAAGHAAGELNAPYNVAFSPDGTTAYVADTGNERIAVYNIATCAGSCPWPTTADYGSRCKSSCIPQGMRHSSRHCGAWPSILPPETSGPRTSGGAASTSSTPRIDLGID